MPEIRLEHITKRWKNFYAVDDLDLVIADNAFVTLLGPSGCGKTTTLRMIAGLETPTSGRITIGDRVVYDSALGINVPANKRKVGFLFQNYALWPNMTVYENISFGLSNIKESMPKIDFEAKNNARLAEILKNPADVRRVVEECRDKKGNLDEKKAVIKLIDEYTISQYTAKKLFAYHVEDGKDVSAAAAELAKKAADAVKANGLNEKYEYVKGGQVIEEVRKLTKEEIDLSVRRVSRIVKISMFMDRYPAELSGGQQQRVAIARTLAPEPSVLFMDEPLSNLDAKLRLEMRYELQRLHVETGSTFVYVTHDQMEAMTLATRICLIDNGRLQQYDEPLTVYNRPNNLFVGDFVGNPSINYIEAGGKEGPDGLSLRFFDGKTGIFRIAGGKTAAAWYQENDKLEAEEKRLAEEAKKLPGYVEKTNKDLPFPYHIARVEEPEIEKRPEPTRDDYVIGVRPEFIRIDPNGAIEGEVFSAMPTGMETTLKIRIGTYLLTAVVFGGMVYKIGQKVRFSFSGDNIMLFSRVNGKRIANGSFEV